MTDQPDAAASAAKAGAIWAGVGIGHTQVSWAELASILAAIYSAMLIVDWIWRKWKAWKRG